MSSTTGSEPVQSRPWLVPTENNDPPKSKVFRVRGVPHGWDRDQLGSFLAATYDSAGPAIRSLAKEVHGRSQTATVLFQNVFRQLQAAQAGHPWEVALPMPPDRPGGSPTLTLDCDFFGLTTLYAPPSQDHKVDLIAISGLGGHAFGSFKQKGGEHMWLCDSLPYHVIGDDGGEPIARVMVYGYESSLWQSDSFQNLEDLGTMFLSHLRRLAVTHAFRPIVFLAHSLGGLIVKQMLISLSKSELEEDQKLIRAVYGIAFFGVPHDGMDISSLISIVGNGPNRFLLESIGLFSSQILSIQQREFPEALGGPGESEIVCFYETRKSPTAKQDERGRWGMVGTKAVLVSKTSATHCRPWENGPQHICAIDRTHSEMVKFGREDHEYDKILERIQSLVRQALIARRCPVQPRLSQKEQDCLQSLAFPQMHDRSIDIDPATKGTCEWLFQHNKYLEWTESDRGLLWIKGKPGSGKSTLLKSALDRQEDALSAEGDLILSFFFHGRGDELQKTPLGFFRSLTHQVLRQMPSTLPNLVDTFEQRRKERGEPGDKWQWHQEELRRFFRSSLPRILKSRTVWLFVDALDESGEDNARKLVEEFKSLLESLAIQPNGPKQLRIIFTCRHYPILDGDCMLHICLEHENGEDISAYVQSRLAASSRLKTSAIADLITSRANGVFMWARLVVGQALALDIKGEGLGKIKKTVNSIPAELHELYEELAQQMDEAPISLKIFQWICFAKRPLSADELRWVLVLNEDCPYKSLEQCHCDDEYDCDIEKRLTTLSRGLAEITSSSDTPVVQFIHESVKEFFNDKGLSILKGGSTPTEVIGMAHFRLASTCVHYLAMEEIRTATASTLCNWESDFPLVRYATISLVEHTKQSDAQGIAPEELLKLFGWPSNMIVDVWTHIYNSVEKYSNDCPPKGTSLLHIISRYEILGSLRAILQGVTQTTVDIDWKDNSGRTPLSWAAGAGREAVVRLLLETGKVEADSKDNNGQTPLSWAAEAGGEAVVRLLLETGKVEADSKDNDGRTPLLWAAGAGHEAVVKLLEAYV